MLPTHRTLINAQGEKHQIHFKSTICVNNVEAMTQLCINGLGVATPPDYLVEEGLSKKTLIELLPGWYVEPIPLYAVWPNNVSQTSNTKRLLAYLLA